MQTNKGLVRAPVATRGPPRIHEMTALLIYLFIFVCVCVCVSVCDIMSMDNGNYIFFINNY